MYLAGEENKRVLKEPVVFVNIDLIFELQFYLFDISFISNNHLTSSESFSLTVLRFFLSGNCFKGSECSFSHDPASTVQTSPHSPTACSFFLKGNCTFGNNCRYVANFG